VSPPRAEAGLEDRCLALGQVRDGTLQRCTLAEHLDGRHRNCRNHYDVRWSVAYKPRLEDGELVDTYRPGDHPGPDPGQDLEPQEPAWDPSDLSQLDREARERFQTAGHWKNGSSPDPTEAPLCGHVDDLEKDHCREWWIKHSDELETNVVHVCHEPYGHDRTRCECCCGKRRRDVTYGPLDPTDRPEEELETFVN
jgi:hypothetical protein